MIKEYLFILSASVGKEINSLSLSLIQSLCKYLHGLFCLKFKNILSGEKYGFKVYSNITC